MAPRLILAPLLRRSLLLPAAGLGLAATAMRYYLTHPQRAVAELPADLAAEAQDVFIAAEDGAQLHAVWLGGRGDRTIVHYHGYNSSGGRAFPYTALGWTWNWNPDPGLNGFALSEFLVSAGAEYYFDSLLQPVLYIPEPGLGLWLAVTLTLLRRRPRGDGRGRAGSADVPIGKSCSTRGTCCR